MKKICVLIFTFVIMVFWVCGSTHAFVIKNPEFNVDGILPSTEPDIQFSNNTGELETSLYTVSGGLLQQRTFNVNGRANYLWPEETLTSGTLVSTLDFTMEARLQVLQIEGTAGAVFQAFDGANRFSAFFQDGGVQLLTDAGPTVVTADVFQFHTYRLESPGNSSTLNFFIDDVIKFSGFAPAYTSLNGFGWADGVTPAGNGADADWDFVRVSQTSPIPEPTTIALLGIGLAGLAGGAVRRRWKKRAVEEG